MTADLKLVETLYDTSLADVPAMLRKTADAIEAGDYGPVGSAGLVLMGDTTCVFGFGQDANGPSVATLLYAGFLRLVKPIEEHGK